MAMLVGAVVSEIDQTSSFSDLLPSDFDKAFYFYCLAGLCVVDQDDPFNLITPKNRSKEEEPKNSSSGMLHTGVIDKPEPGPAAPKRQIVSWKPTTAFKEEDQQRKQQHIDFGMLLLM